MYNAQNEQRKNYIMGFLENKILHTKANFSSDTLEKTAHLEQSLAFLISNNFVISNEVDRTKWLIY